MKLLKAWVFKMKIIITGCNGRMGKEIIELILSDEYKNLIEIVCGVTSSNYKNSVKRKYGDNVEIFITDDIEQYIRYCDLVIDFTTPNAALQFAEICAYYNKAFLTGTTGFVNDELHILDQFAKQIPLFWSANMSISINIIMQTIGLLAQKLDRSYDIEILEMHHNRKKDAPSGTALMLGKAAARGRNLDFDKVATFNQNRSFTQKKKDDIGFAVIRGGNIIGNHTVVFAGENDYIEISHNAINRSAFASGALKAAVWLVKQSAGRLYTMNDILI